jgi:hypothetical protein
VEDEPPRPNPATNGERPAVPVQKEEVEGEPHAEGVDAQAAGKQQTGPGHLAG